MVLELVAADGLSGGGGRRWCYGSGGDAVATWLEPPAMADELAEGLGAENARNNGLPGWSWRRGFVGG